VAQRQRHQRARLEEDGYPRTEFNLYDSEAGADPQVEVLEHQTMQNVILQLGLKSGILTIRVVDANSNQPLHHADITIRRVDLPDRFMSTGLIVEEGEFKIPVPSLPFTVKVSVKGYEDWYYKIAGEGNKASALLMAPNSTKKLLVALHPVGRSN